MYQYITFLSLKIKYVIIIYTKRCRDYRRIAIDYNLSMNNHSLYILQNIYLITNIFR